MILKTGFLTKKEEHKNCLEPYIVKTIGIESLYDVENLQQRVYRELKRKEVLVTDSLETMAKDLSGGGQILGVYNGSGELIAYRFVSFPKNVSHNLGLDIGLSEKELMRVAHLETTVVHPSYRGNALQSETLKLAIPLIQEQGVRHILCTVSPFNPHSLYNVMVNGLKVKALKQKYGTSEDPAGLWRFILHRDMEATSSKVIDWLNVSMKEISRQEKLIENGFVGNYLNREAQVLQYIKTIKTELAL